MRINGTLVSDTQELTSGGLDTALLESCPVTERRKPCTKEVVAPALLSASFHKLSRCPIHQRRSSACCSQDEAEQVIWPRQPLCRASQAWRAHECQDMAPTTQLVHGLPELCMSQTTCVTRLPPWTWSKTGIYSLTSSISACYGPSPVYRYLCE